MWSVEVFDRELTPVMVPGGLRLAPLRYGWHVMGGPLDAEIGAAGERDGLLLLLQWLGYRVRIYNDIGTPVWWGFVFDVTVDTGGLAVGAGLGEMVNRCNVLYTNDTPNGSVATETGYDENALSVARYGTREAIVSMNNVSEAAALARRAEELTKAAPRLTRRQSSRAVGATLNCRGLWELLDWSYYSQPDGYIAAEVEERAERMLGWGLTSALIGFDGRANRIHDGDARLAGVPVGSELIATGSSSNNATHVVSETTTRAGKAVVLTGGTLTFEPQDDIRDDDSRLDRLDAPEMILVDGTTDNDHYWFLKTADADHVTVRPGDVTGETPSGTVTVYQGNSLGVESSLTTERPGASVTLTALGVQMAQAYTPDTAWTLAEVWLPVHRVGAPGDNFIVELMTNNAGVPDTVLDTVTTTGTDLPTASGVRTRFAFSNTVTPAASTTYWIRLRRSGSNDAAAYYVLGIDDTAASGDFLLYTGSAWELQSGQSMPMDLYGAESNAAQIERIVDGVEDLVGVDTGQVDADVESNQYYDGSLTRLDVMLDLLKSGNSAGEQWRATVDAAWRLVVAPVGDVDDPAYKIGYDGRLRPARANELEAGICPVGEWVLHEELPHVGGVLADGPVLIAASEYDVASGALSWEADAEWGIGIRNG